MFEANRASHFVARDQVPPKNPRRFAPAVEQHQSGGCCRDYLNAFREMARHRMPLPSVDKFRLLV